MGHERKVVQSWCGASNQFRDSRGESNVLIRMSGRCV